MTALLLARCAWHPRYVAWWPRWLPFVCGVKRAPGVRGWAWTDGICRRCWTMARAEIPARKTDEECDCAACLRSRQIEHLTAFVAGDQVEALLEYARAGEAALLDEMWAGTLARLWPGKRTPRVARGTSTDREVVESTPDRRCESAPTEAEVARAVQALVGGG